MSGKRSPANGQRESKRYRGNKNEEKKQLNEISKRLAESKLSMTMFTELLAGRSESKNQIHCGLTVKHSHDGANIVCTEYGKNLIGRACSSSCARNY